MRPSICLLSASSSLAGAAWIKLPGHSNLVGRGSFPPPRETGRSSPEEASGWTPRPTPAPGSRTESDIVLNLLRVKRADSTSTTWLDDTTCGWTAGVSSDPYTCESEYTCTTNAANVVGCASGTYVPFFTVCLDMQAYEQGACASIGPQTGCCQTSGYGACGTFLWTGTPVRSMYRCFPQPTIISMNDEPQFVIDAATSTTSVSSTSTSPSSSATTSAPVDNNDDDKPSTNIGAIVGGVVGGVGALALIAGLAAWLILRSKRKAKNGQTYNAVATDASKPHAQAPPQMVQNFAGGYQPVQAGGGGPVTFQPASPYPASVSTATAYDPRQSYHDPSKSPALVSHAAYSPPPGQQHVFPGYTQAPGSPPPGVEVAGPYNPPYVVVSELDSAMKSGSHDNPVEIGGK